MLLYFLALIVGAEGKLECKAKGPCGCELDDGSGYFDLSPMMKYGMSPMFVGVDMKEGINVFSVDLCQKFTCLNNKDSLICASSTVQPATIIGDTLSSFEADNDELVKFIYTAQNQGQTITTRVTLHCSQNQGIGSLSNFEKSAGSQVFTTTLTSQHACLHRGSSGGGGGNKKKGLSTGSIMCIILLVLVVVYLVGGILINKYVRKIEDESLVPNVEFWKALPGYIKDGCKFSFSKVKRNKEYEKI